MPIGEVVALAIGIMGVAGVIFTALKYNRDDTTAVVSQQSQILGDMKALNDELRATVTDLRSERDDLRAEVARLTGQVEALRSELGEAHARLSGQVSRLQDKLNP